MRFTHRPSARVPGKAICTPALLLALLVSPAGESFAQVESVVVNKSYGYVQMSDTTVVVDPSSNAYGFSADVNGQNIGSITAPTISGPINVAALGTTHNNGRLIYSPGDKGWRYGFPNADDFGTSSLANLNSLFGSGTYTFTVNGATIPLRLTGDAYPNAPIVTLSGGAWVGGKYVIDPAQPLTVTTNAFTAYGSHADDLICVGAIGGKFIKPFASVAPWGCNWGIPGQLARQFHSSVPGTNFLSITYPPNTFVAGQEYAIGGGFEAMVDVHPDPALPGSTNVASYGVSTFLTLSVVPPVFPMVVTGSIGPVTSNITATIQYRPQDIGTSGSIYAFAMAPASIVKSAKHSEAPFTLGHAKLASGEKDTSVACVLAQLNSSGQLQATSIANVQAYLTGALTSLGQAVPIINNVPTSQISGATFYVGYGTSASSMISGGINRSVVTVPGTGVCKPEAPQTGWWWNPAEGGRGFSIEAQANHLFYASFLYDETGRSTWYVTSGSTSLDGSLFTGDLLGVRDGQTLAGPYRAPSGLTNYGPITLTFSDASHGTMVWPGGVVPIQREALIPNGLSATAKANQPENGWWWNASENGRGFFIEWQGSYARLAGYMYDDKGERVWYITVADTTGPTLYSGTWLSLANGQTLTGTFKPASIVNNNVAPVTVQFTSATTATMTLPGGKQLALTRFLF